MGLSMVVDIHTRNGIRPHFDVYIGRRIRYHPMFTKDSKWRNRSGSLEEYEKWACENLWDALDELKGKVLGCWCVTTSSIEPPLRCHGQVLMKLLHEKQEAERRSHRISSFQYRMWGAIP